MRLGSTSTAMLGLVGALSGMAEAAPNPLAAYRGAARVLILSASDAGDPRLAQQRTALTSLRAGAAERDLVIVEAVGDGPEARAVRRSLGIQPTGFRAVLVGKDGGVKTSSAEPIPPQRLFSTIDAMPMRRQEMERRR